jgi:hypothetical protein
VGRDLIEDIDRKFQQAPDRTHGFWTIDLEMSGGGARPWAAAGST